MFDRPVVVSSPNRVLFLLQLFNRERSMLPSTMREDVLQANGLQLPGGYLTGVLQKLRPQSQFRYTTVRLHRIRRVHLEGAQIADRSQEEHQFHQHTAPGCPADYGAEHRRRTAKGHRIIGYVYIAISSEVINQFPLSLQNSIQKHRTYPCYHRNIRRMPRI